MVTRLNPYITFGGNAREAMEFYQSVFGGQLDISTWGDMPDMPGNDASLHHNVMHAMLTVSDSVTLMGADTPGAAGPKDSPITISLSGEDEAQLRGWWDGLSAGGEVTMPLERAPWGDTFGQCTDRYGVSWMVNVVQAQ
jgi:PhnB protein